MAAAEIIDRIRQKRAGEYAKSDDFQHLIISGYAQMQAGENPVDLIKAQSGLAAIGIPAANAGAMIKDMLGHLQQAAQHKEFNAVQKENAPQPEFMKTVTPSPADRDSMELGGFDPNQNESLSKMMPATPEKQMTPNQSARIAGPQAFNNLSQVGSFLQVPQNQELLQARTADEQSQTKTRGNLQRMEDLKYDTLQGMNGDGEPNNRELALFPSTANRMDQRAKAADPLEEDRRKLLQAQAGHAEGGAFADRARGKFYNERDRTGGRGAQGSEVTTDQEKAAPAVMTGTFSLAPKTGVLGMVGLGPKAPTPQDKLVAERTIARAAEDRGVADLPPEQQGAALGAIADEFGFKLSGTPTLRPSSSARTTKTTTRGDQGGAPLVRNAQPPKAQPAQKQPAMIRVKEKASGRTGSLPAGEFDPKLYEKIQ